MSIQTLSELFLVAAGHRKPDCLLHKVDGRWVPVSTDELADQVRRLAKALHDAGVGAGDRIALMAENGVHWPTVDFAAQCLGAVLVPIYPTLTADQASYVVADSGARILFVEGRERLDGMLGEAAEMPDVTRWVVIGESDPSGRAGTLEEMMAEGDGVDEQWLEQRARAVDPEDMATFIYTSGTTGKPKGVMLTHRNIVSNVLACLEVMDIEGRYTALSFLPLSHSFERTVDYIYFYRGVSIAYAESVQAVGQNLMEIEPHVFVSVPRVYEKVFARVQEKVLAGSAVQQRIFAWAQNVARRALDARIEDRRPSGLLGLELALADKLVFGKIKSRLGSRFEFAMSGGAPLARDLAEFFWGAGIRIFEGYGLSETSPVLTVNTRDHVRLGTVGRAIPGIDLRIAEDGEILARGPNIMAGYHNLPEESAETIDDEGWFHTGDIGEIDEDGFLRITDRKKEIIVNAYGKNVAPAPIENALKSSRFIGQAVVIGDRRKFLSALLVPDFESLEVWAESQGLDPEDRPELVEHPKVQALVAGEIGEVNRELARYEQVHAWKLLPEEFTIESGELTPTQKIKRRVVHDTHAEAIEQMYQNTRPPSG